MLLDRYESLFFNTNFKEAASDAGWVAYRGELVITEGEIADAQGRRKPPQDLLKQAALLACGDELKLITGSLDELQYFPLLLAKYGADFKPGLFAIFFTVNIDKPFVATTNGVPVVFIPLVQGMAWNELIDLVGLEKSDFKGLSAADKVVTLYNALKDHQFKYPEVALSEALTKTNNAKRETHGAI
ncbi:MAG: hypothetical protein CVU34_08380 [Betaproteobacteria bacterium HGW-Betaproteobacteria-7]|jgi:hypothetical protein|nr:MAG: hypothetical protein CVU34_08380 [Betaproteobacteria bacterium HGW-Betaproteobacteria-7]